AAAAIKIARILNLLGNLAAPNMTKAFPKNECLLLRRFLGAGNNMPTFLNGLESACFWLERTEATGGLPDCAARFNAHRGRCMCVCASGCGARGPPKANPPKRERFGRFEDASNLSK